MFVCEPCRKRVYRRSGSAVHFSGSTGPCEHCGKNAVCHNCYCSVPRPVAPALLKPAVSLNRHEAMQRAATGELNRLFEIIEALSTALNESDVVLERMGIPDTFRLRQCNAAALKLARGE